MKKLCALFLCIAMLMSLVCVAQAATSVNVQETFDDLTVGATSWSRTVFGNYQTNEENGAVFRISDDGYIGNCLHITENDTTTYTLRSKLQASALAASNVYTFKIKVVNDVNSTAAFRINANNAGLLYIQSGEIICQGGGRFNYEVGTWYDVAIEFTSTQTNVRVKDDKGNTISGYRAGTYDHLRFTQSTGGIVTNAEIAIDEVRLIQGDGTDAVNFVSSDYGAVPSDVVVTDVVYEGFEDYESSGATFQNYLANNTAEFANVAMHTPNYFTLTMVDDCNGGRCPELSGFTKNNQQFTTVGAAIESGSKSYATMKIKMLDTTSANVGYFGFGSGGNTGNELFVRGGTFYTWNYWGRTNTYTYTPDVWYTIVVEYEMIDSTKCANLYIYDDNNTLVYSATPTGAAHRTIDVARMSFVFDQTANVAIDDIRVIKATGTVNSEAFITSEILGGESGSEVYTTTPVIKAEFDQIVADGSVAKFTAAGKDDIDATIKYTGSSLVEIVPATPLDYGTDYTLDLSGIKGLGGQGLASSSVSALSIKTPDYSVGTMTVGTPAFSGTQMSVPVTFTNAASPELNAYVIGAFYSGNKLSWVEVKEVVGADMGENTITFKNLPDGASQMELKVFAWDNFTSLKPLFK